MPCPRYWDVIGISGRGSAEGFASRELVGYAMGISSLHDLIPRYDFL